MQQNFKCVRERSRGWCIASRDRWQQIAVGRDKKGPSVILLNERSVCAVVEQSPKKRRQRPSAEASFVFNENNTQCQFLFTIGPTELPVTCTDRTERQSQSGYGPKIEINIWHTRSLHGKNVNAMIIQIHNILFYSKMLFGWNLLFHEPIQRNKPQIFL